MQKRNRQSLSRTVARLLRNCLSPREEGSGGPATLAERERLRRGRLLASYIPATVALGGLLLSACWGFFPAACLPGLIALLAVHCSSALLNRAGRVEVACWVYVMGQAAAYALALFLFARDLVIAATLVYSLFAIVVVQAGFLVERRAGALAAGLSVILIGVHIFLSADAFRQVPLFGPFSLFGVLAATLFLMAALAVLTWITAASLEHAVACADRGAEVERLYADLRRSHAELAAKAEAMREVQAALRQANEQLEEANRHLEQQATTDGMTGLPNHRAFQEALRAQISHALRYGQPLSLLMVDVDRFKQFNDRYGHPAGDGVLRTVANVLRQSVRAGDLAARYGGEEFAVLLPQTGLDRAAEAAERLRAAVEQTDHPCAQVTVSVGVACLPVHGTDANALVNAADTALYLAKTGGRNRVVVSDAASPALETTEPVPAMIARADATAPVPASVPAADAWGGVEGLLQEPAGQVLAALLATLDLRDAAAIGHSLRVARSSLRLARGLAARWDAMRAEGRDAPVLTPGDLRKLALGALLHDVGKIHIPDQVLGKRGALKFDEWRTMRLHPELGVELISRVSCLSPALEVVRHHHERWDGTGYPDGLEGEGIPLVARIFAVCDAFDAMTTARPYRAARSYEEALTELRTCAGTHFDPEVVAAFAQIPLAEWEALREGAPEPLLLRAAA